MFNKYKEFIEKRPYAHVILIMVFTSFIGISIEYIVNKNFIGAGLYSALRIALIEILRVRRKKVN
ncbi:hypothetical protein JTF06_09925 [Desemzia sp. RIT804]|uniref:hypothetical protein n=1 Tax=Desemzia sp. RIT 804 TaxID=2810209 RepID=UPI00195262CB|nr:hypothetical protein [Desemzia sp. RIT 804]MBM6615204.1 hypothetical protein [Desemzia sp. RIT 804]